MGKFLCCSLVFVVGVSGFWLVIFIYICIQWGWMCAFRVWASCCMGGFCYGLYVLCVAVSVYVWGGLVYICVSYVGCMCGLFVLCLGGYFGFRSLLGKFDCTFLSTSNVVLGVVGLGG
jgi:hypothetical protein